MSIKNWKIIQYKKIKVYYLETLDGGGMYFVNDYIGAVRKMFGKVDRLCEFASGPGFIGFSLLANGLCKQLSLIDVNPLAIECCLQTIRANGLEKVVKTYVSDGFAKIPKKGKWDLVVSNPPHFSGTLKMHDRDMIKIDPGWTIHQKFYKGVSGHLANGGSVLFVENYKGSNPQMWIRMIEKEGLFIVKTFNQSRSLFYLLRNLQSLILSLRLANTIGKLKKNYAKPSKAIYPHYFVWSKKLK